MPTPDDIYAVPTPVAEAAAKVIEAARLVSDRLKAEWIPLELTDDDGREDGDAGEILHDALDKLKAVKE